MKKSLYLGPYGKAIVAGLGAAALYLSDNVLDVNDVVQVALAVLGVLGVYTVSNDKPAPAPEEPVA